MNQHLCDRMLEFPELLCTTSLVILILPMVDNVAGESGCVCVCVLCTRKDCYFFMLTFLSPANVAVTATQLNSPIVLGTLVQPAIDRHSHAAACGHTSSAFDKWVSPSVGISMFHLCAFGCGLIVVIDMKQIYLNM